MTTNHIDQLAQWYADAEQITKTNLPRKGDTLIYPRLTSGYIIESDDGGWTPEIVPSTGETVRILARAPKPKPAWHDAVAVIAHIGGNELPRVLVRDNDGAFVDGVTGHAYAADRLRDVTPLIEAKVTDEMVHVALTAYYGDPFTHEDQYSDEEQADMRNALTAALGLETE